MRGEAEPTGGAVLLRLGESRYAVDLAAVAEVVPVPPVTRVPDQPAWLCGVANWRGRVLPVVDLRLMLGGPVVPLPSSARLVVLQDVDLTLGVVAEAVPGVYGGDLAEAAPPPATLTGDAALLVSGQVTDGRGPVALLDPVAVLGLRGRLDRARTFA